MKYVSRIILGWFLFAFASTGALTLKKDEMISLMLFIMIIVASCLILFVSKEEAKRLREADLGSFE